ncbi:MAG TPA: isocitrate lyase/PEP mutase family protein [Candidatus Limnocylindria bacterium]|nr:isocitrate lyase/PEP mutase family protein [Candidatus Limnocylindria bacterium]
MPPEPSAADRLRERLATAGPLLLPGCADALTARIAVDVGFEAVYATGAGISNAMLGMPDVGLATMTEMADQIARICDAVEVPVVADMDTGYGNAVNARRAVRAFEAAGVAAVQIEDQVFPKRCGHFAGKDVIGVAEMRAKLLAVLEGRRNPATVVIARTDAIAVEGVEAAVERANQYAALGADLVFVEAPPSSELLAQLPPRIDAPLVANMVEGGLTPIHSVEELGAMGYRVVLYANTALRAGMLAVRSALETLRAEGSSRSLADRLVSWEERQRLVGKPAIDELEGRYADPDPE